MAGLLSDAEVASMTALIRSSLDVTVTVQRVTSSTDDGYGHSTGPQTTTSSIKANLFAPSGSYLQAYADIIGSQKAMMMRYMPEEDVRQGDTVLVNDASWKVQRIDVADSYTFVNDALITRVS